ncbi:hypothetical protein BCR44DRAFT_1425852 [Catenaria anguillulae PL171]|uniref:ABC transporter domain-containing protein n=1 Tax=Catenaria anguillulae PL171 TaxID=765915 RepID=A0A1Y2I1S2_9FUNG|nr:hypothetical protein BCR44DRAFT_1425852 [Catenaria anguillulae PL171]
MASFLGQVQALLEKNFLTLSRSPIQLFLTLFAPFGVLLGSVYATNALSASLVAAAMAWRAPDFSSPPIHQVGYANCAGGGVLNVCSDRPRVYFAPNDAYHTKVMERFASENSVRMGVDVIPLPTLDALAKLVIEKQPAIQREWPTTYAVAFTTWGTVETRFNQSTGKEPQFLDTPVTMDAARSKFLASQSSGTYYTISSVPKAMSMSGPTSSPLLANIVYDGATLIFKHALDAAIIRTRAVMEGRTPPSLNITMSHYAIPATATASANPYSSRDNNADAQASANRLASSFVSSFILFGFCPMTLTLALMVSNEKHKGMLGNLRKLGMSEIAYWTAMLFTVAIVGGAASAIALLAIPAFPPGFVMHNWHPSVTFGVLFILAFHLVSLALVIVSLFAGPYSTNIFLGFYCFIGILGTSLMGSMESTGLNVYLLVFWDTALGYGLALLPMFSYGKAHSELTQAALKQPNSTITWTDSAMTVMRNVTVMSYDYQSSTYKYNNIIGPTTRDSLLLMLLIGSCSYAVCIYANQVFGGAQPLWFPLLPSYWGIESGNATNPIHTRARENKSLIVDSLQKTFTTFKFCGCQRRKVKAVKHVSFEVRQGRVLSLLGVNGAGKSTTINMVSGLIRPNQGTVSCFGTSNMGKIQQNIGVVPQSDITWPELTAGDHVRLYARMRGVHMKGTSMREYTLNQLKRVGLEDNIDTQVSKFSGGMRRRLCVLLCAVGEPPVCILDEPSASLDPINRLKVHQFIMSLKSHAAVILTTHLLAEADQLGDTICIIDGGEVRAAGTSLALKRQYAPVYEVTLLSQAGVSLSQLQPVIETYSPKATIVQRSTEMYALTIPRDEGMASLLRFLQSSDPTRVKLIREFEVSNSSLEQVFLNVSQQAQAERIAAAVADGTAGNSGDTEGFEMPSFPARQSFFKHVAAVFLKDWTFQFKQFKTTVAIFFLSCSLLIVMVYMLGFMQLEELCPAGHQVLDASTGMRLRPYSSQQPRTCNLSFISDRVKRSWGVCAPGSPLGCLIGDYVLPSSMVKQSLAQSSDPWSPTIQEPATQLSQSARFLFRDPTQARESLLMWTQPRRNLSADAVNIPGDYSSWSPSAGSASSMFSQWPRWPVQVLTTANDPAADVRDTIRTLTSTPQLSLPAACVPLQPWTWGSQQNFVHNSTNIVQNIMSGLPEYGISIEQFTPTASELHISTAPGGSYLGQEASRTTLKFYSATSDGRNCTFVQYRQLRAPGEALRYNISNRVLRPDIAGMYWSEIDYEGDSNHVELLHSIANAQLRRTLGSQESIFGSINTLPSIPGPELLVVLPLFLIPSAIYVLFIAYLQVPFYEKEFNLIDFYRINGLSTSATWIGHYLFSFSLSIPIVAAAVVITAIYVPTIAVGSFIFISLVAIHGAICMAFFLAGIIQSTTMARLISFLFPAIAGALSSTLVLFSSAPLPGIAGLFPPLAFARNMYQLTFGGGIDASLIVVAIFAGLVYLGIAVLLFNVTDMSPLVIVSNWFYRVKAKYMKQRKSAIKVSHGATADALVEVGATVAVKDPSMNREVSTATQEQGGSLSTESGVHVVNVTKSFGPTNVLKGVSMSVTKGTTFGLLGPNGSGKTTLINILTGVSRPNSGQAWVAGTLSTSRGLSQVLSVCPQADLVLGDLTVEENLRFFARMRGTPLFGTVLDNVVKHTAKNVGLADAMDRSASQLSGGMRRRLALGIAVVGGPKVMLCDEVSAGLDAGNRIAIWRLLGKIREAEDPPTIIITTHFMNEAEALCSRIGILAGGKMRVMGNQVALRAKYGQGYTLNMQVPVSAPGTARDKPISIDQVAQEAETAGMDAIVNELKSHLNLDLTAEHEQFTGQAGQRACGGQFNTESGQWEWEVRVKVRLPAACDLATVFELMSYAPRGVQDWGIVHSSLEDVFVKVATQQYPS